MVRTKRPMDVTHETFGLFAKAVAEREKRIQVANKPKIQGTKFESATRDLLLDWGFKAYRLAEGGLKDEEDVQVEAT